MTKKRFCFKDIMDESGEDESGESGSDDGSTEEGSVEGDSGDDINGEIFKLTSVTFGPMKKKSLTIFVKK